MSINTSDHRIDITGIISWLEKKLLLPTGRAVIDILEMTKDNPAALLTVAGMFVLEGGVQALVGFAIFKSFSIN